MDEHDLLLECLRLAYDKDLSAEQIRDRALVYAELIESTAFTRSQWLAAYRKAKAG